MSSTIRTLKSHSRSLSKSIKVANTKAPIRSFHSPFVVLNTPTSPLNTASSSVSYSALYEKQAETLPDPKVSHSGTRSYVVSEPDPSNTPYQVPSGAYPTSAPYVNYTATEAPDTKGAQTSSTSSGLAHYATTRAAPHNASGVGESAAVRNAEAPGQLGARGGSSGGLGLMDKAGTKKGVGELADRNPQPDGEVAAQFSKQGVDNAWKTRK